MSARTFPLLLCIALIFKDLSAQMPADSSRARVAFEAAFHAGNLFRHTPKLSIQTGQRVPGFELGLRFVTQGRREWQALQGFPIFGLALCRFVLGEAAHGTAHGLLPNLSVPIFRRKTWAAMFRFGTGLGYVARPYDYFQNPGQNAIGSHWNNITQFRLGAEIRLGGHWRALAGGSFTHFSNGSAALPNLGVNIPAGYFALTYSPENETFAPRKRSVSRRPARRWGGQMQTGAAWVEYIVWDGPRHPIWSAAGAVTCALTRTNRAALGVDWEQNRAIFAWGLATTDFKTPAAARHGATRLTVKLADEFLFGNLGVSLETGLYVGQRAGLNHAIPAPIFNKLGIRYYFPPLFGARGRLFAGIYLKSHRINAEYISANVGLGF